MCETERPPCPSPTATRGWRKSLSQEPPHLSQVPCDWLAMQSRAQSHFPGLLLEFVQSLSTFLPTLLDLTYDLRKFSDTVTEGAVTMRVHRDRDGGPLAQETQAVPSPSTPCGDSPHWIEHEVHRELCSHPHVQF